MPRRDALSEKKRERLMQEHEQLQKLMLEARSSARRSSLKEQNEENVNGPEYETTSEQPSLEQKEDVPVILQQEEPQEPDTLQKAPLTEAQLFQNPITIEEPEAKMQPLTENDLFPVLTTSQDGSAEKRPLTETEIFPQLTNETAPQQPVQKSSAVNIILPAQQVAAAVTHANVRRTGTEENYRNTVSENSLTTEERMPVGESATVYNDDVEEQRSGLETRVPIEEYTTTFDSAAEERRSPKTLRYILLLAAALLAGFGGYYLYVTNHYKNTSVAKQNRVPVAIPPAPAVVPKSEPAIPTDSTVVQKTNLETINRAQPADTKTNETNVVETPVTPVVKPPVAEKEKTETPAATPNASLGKYNVVMKAYFHNEPDESTRRKAFIIHWNNAVLTPIEEKNGFVYVVFTNHLGQTSKGWLRKSDLKRID